LAATTFTYDNAARRTGVTNPLNKTTTTIYYANGTVQAVQDPLNNRTTYLYDGARRPTVVTDANNHSTTTTYDTANRRVIVQDPTGARVTTVYDVASRRVQLIDGNGHVTTFAYDTAGRLWTTTDPKLRVTTLAYDGANNVIGKQDARPLTGAFSFDPNNRPSGESYPGYLSTFQYDPVGNRTLAQNPAGSYVTTFTARNQVESVSDPNSQTIGYAYDANRQRQTMTDPASGVYTSTRDAAGRLRVLENPRGEQTNYTYDVNERLTNTGLANGGQELRGYDIADRLTSVVTNDALGNALTAFTYLLDGVGNRTQVSDYAGKVTQFTYSTRNEMLQEAVTAAPIAWVPFTLAQWVAFTLAQWVDFVLDDGPSGTITHTYDAVGNRQVMTDNNGVTTTYSYDAANQLTTSIDSTGALTTYTYDGAGNLIGQNVAGAVTSYLFDGPNRLMEVYPATGSDVTFLYDPDGRRVEKEVDGSELTRFVWDGERLLVENNSMNDPQVEYTQGDGSVGGGLGNGGFGNLVSEYQYGGGEPISYQHAFDALGSTGALVDGSGSVDDRWQYSAFGLQQSPSPSDEEPTRLTFGGQKGYQFDSELDLYYCRNRYYDPATGRWINQDPAKADELNTYRYVGNNPVRALDPSGLHSVITPEGAGHQVIWEFDNGSMAPIGRWFGNTVLLNQFPNEEFKLDALQDFATTKVDWTADERDAELKQALAQFRDEQLRPWRLARGEAAASGLFGLRARELAGGDPDVIEERRMNRGRGYVRPSLGGAIRGLTDEIIFDTTGKSRDEIVVGMIKSTIRATGQKVKYSDEWYARQPGRWVFDLPLDIAANPLTYAGGMSAFGEAGAAFIETEETAATVEEVVAAANSESDLFSGLESIAESTESAPRVVETVPNPVDWAANGGRVQLHADGSMTYTSAAGKAVRYTPSQGTLFNTAGERLLEAGVDAPATRPLGARGPISRREFDAAAAGGPVRQLTTNRIRITNKGIDAVEQHVGRFGPDAANEGMIKRLREIAAGQLEPAQADLNFYSHELRESVRYRRLGWRTGQPSDMDASYDLWNNAHTATLEDYGLREGPGILYHPSVQP
jgi:RHS repeat-associated protein